MGDNKKKPKLQSCSQCGASELKREGPYRMRCEYCGSVYEIQNTSAGVVINKGAHVVFGKNAKVVIAGGLEIKEGATVQFDGELQLIEKGDETAIQGARVRLKEEGAK
jgi:hypothetical protein